jgi:hypothetical protein
MCISLISFDLLQDAPCEDEVSIKEGEARPNTASCPSDKPLTFTFNVHHYINLANGTILCSESRKCRNKCKIKEKLKSRFVSPVMAPQYHVV